MRTLIVAASLLLPTVTLAAVPTLAVTYFDNNSSDARYDPLGHGLADMLITDLSGLENLRVVERGRLTEILSELELQGSSFVDPATAVAVGKGLGAQYVLTGAFIAVDPSMRIDARIVNVSTGEVVQAESVTGPAEEFFLLEKDLAHQIIERLGVSVSSRESARMGRVATENFDAFLAYSEGLEALDRGALDEARDRINAALESDDRFSLASSTLDDLERRLQEHRQTGRVASSQYARDVIVQLDAIAASDDAEALGKLTFQLQGRLMDIPSSRDMLAVSGRLLDMELDDSVKMGGPKGYTGVNEWALYGHTAAAYWLGDRGTTLSYGEEFLGRFPTSAFAVGLRGYLDHVLRISRGEKAGRPQIPALRASALAMPLMMGCVMNREPESKLQACRDWSDLQDEAGDLIERNEDTEVNWAQAGLHAGDLDEIRKALDHVRARDKYAKGVERIEDLLETGRERQAAAEQAARSGRDATTEEDFLAPATALILGARYDDAKALIERGLGAHPGGNSLYQLGTDLALTTFDIDYGESIIARWEAAEAAHGARVKAGAARNIRELPDEFAEIARMQGVGMQMYAATLAGAGLYKEAGDAYIECARAGWDEANSLSTAGNMYQASLHPAEARAAFQAVLDRFPEGSVGVAAKSMLELLP